MNARGIHSRPIHIGPCTSDTYRTIHGFFIWPNLRLHKTRRMPCGWYCDNPTNRDADECAWHSFTSDTHRTMHVRYISDHSRFLPMPQPTLAYNAQNALRLVLTGLSWYRSQGPFAVHIPRAARYTFIRTGSHAHLTPIRPPPPGYGNLLFR